MQSQVQAETDVHSTDCQALAKCECHAGQTEVGMGTGCGRVLMHTWPLATQPHLVRILRVEPAVCIPACNTLDHKPEHVPACRAAGT